MFSSLRLRLLLSYVVVIVVCLLLVSLALILVARPIQERVQRARLVSSVNYITPLVQRALSEGRSLRLVSAAVDRAAAARDTQLLLLNPDGRIVYDSGDRWVGRQVARPADSDGITTGIIPELGTRGLAYAALPLDDEQRQIGWLVAVGPAVALAGSIIDSLREGMCIAGVVSIVLSVLLALLISSWIARPMRHMARAAESFAAGNYDYPLDIKQPREARSLADSMRHMASQVKSSQQATRDLVANVSHDLKTPLTSVQGFAQALLDGVADDAASRRHAAEVIYTEAGRMVRMVDHLSQLARIDAGQLSLDVRPLDLAAVIEGLSQALEPAAAEKDISIDMSLPVLPTVEADGDRIAQAFTNLMDNAIKHNQPGGWIRIEGEQLAELPVRLATESRAPARPTSRFGAWVTISISDNGQGIPADELPRVFERFYQVDKSRAPHRGRGLGLAIAKEIVEAHAGRIDVESVEGLGTRFVVYLPAVSLD